MEKWRESDGRGKREKGVQGEREKEDDDEEEENKRREDEDEAATITIAPLRLLFFWSVDDWVKSSGVKQFLFINSAGIYKPTDEPPHVEGNMVKADAGHVVVEKYISSQRSLVTGHHSVHNT